MKKVLTCVGTRPNFIKITQLEKYFIKHPNIQNTLLHTGQHFDDNMSDIFFKQLNIKKPDVYLNINTGSQLDVIAGIIVEMDKYLQKLKPDLLMVPGDVNSSFACAFAASRLGIPVAHIESGLRSFDKTMPEEVNRILIDDIAELFFITEQSGLDNLIAENKNKNNMHFVGNTMIDTLITFLPLINNSKILDRIPLNNKLPLLTITFHRPSNVDNPDNLKKLIDTLISLSKDFFIVFPIHPRTKQNLQKFFSPQFSILNSKLLLIDPLGYIDFLKLVINSKIVITDSGGIQEETTYLKIPCLTVRSSTERPITITEGSNSLLDLDENIILNSAHKVLNNNYKKSNIPKLWDGRASERMVEIIAKTLAI